MEKSDYETIREILKKRIIPHDTSRSKIQVGGAVFKFDADGRLNEIESYCGSCD